MGMAAVMQSVDLGQNSNECDLDPSLDAPAEIGHINQWKRCIPKRTPKHTKKQSRSCSPKLLPMDSLQEYPLETEC